MPEQKKAFVFDTNFIIQHKELDKVIESLKEEYVVYVTQVSIDERVAQYCRDAENYYDEAKKIEQKARGFLEVKLNHSLEEAYEYWQKGLQSNYEKNFGERIIPFKKNGNTLTEILN